MRWLFGRAALPVQAWPVDDLWAVQFIAPIDGHLQDCLMSDMSHSAAERALRLWRTMPDRRQIWCRSCPLGDIPHCPHSGDPGWFGWANREIREMRIMPMREVIW